MNEEQFEKYLIEVVNKARARFTDISDAELKRGIENNDRLIRTCFEWGFNTDHVVRELSI
jgi:hypothetical protein